MATLTTLALEESTYVITASFLDEDGSTVVPNVGTVTWTLTDLDGTVINSRSAVAIASASTITIVLQGDDLALQNIEDSGVRKVLVQAQYDSSIGSNLPLNDEVQFTIDHLVAVT
jgi:hypothetical protein